MPLSEADVRRVARLARLALPDEAIIAMQAPLNRVLDYIDTLKQLDTENVSPTMHVVRIQNAWRGDVVQQSLPREVVLQNAPQQESNMFRVPRIVEEATSGEDA